MLADMLNEPDMQGFFHDVPSRPAEKEELRQVHLAGEIKGQPLWTALS